MQKCILVCGGAGGGKCILLAVLNRKSTQEIFGTLKKLRNHKLKRGSKGALLRGFCCVQVNSVLKSMLSTFTCTQNAPSELRSYQMREGEQTTTKLWRIFQGTV